MYNKRIKIFGRCPTEFLPEHNQFQRATLAIMNIAALECEWAVILRNFAYSHKAGERIECDKDWNGQFDIVVLANHKIIIYELKASTVNLVWTKPLRGIHHNIEP